MLCLGVLVKIRKTYHKLRRKYEAPQEADALFLFDVRCYGRRFSGRSEWPIVRTRTDRYAAVQFPVRNRRLNRARRYEYAAVQRGRLDHGRGSSPVGVIAFLISGRR